MCLLAQIGEGESVCLLARRLHGQHRPAADGSLHVVDARFEQEEDAPDHALPPLEREEPRVHRQHDQPRRVARVRSWTARGRTRGPLRAAPAAHSRAGTHGLARTPERAPERPRPSRPAASHSNASRAPHSRTGTGRTRLAVPRKWQRAWRNLGPTRAATRRSGPPLQPEPDENVAGLQQLDDSQRVMLERNTLKRRERPAHAAPIRRLARQNAAVVLHVAGAGDSLLDPTEG